MDEQQLHERCMALHGAEETYPFGDDARVYKVMNKMFALLTKDELPPSISLKCDPTFGDVLRGMYPAIKPGYHLNKRHWITVTVDGSIPDEEVTNLIKDSYALVVKGLTKAERDKLTQQPG